ncbi:hypothetical protein N7456_004035 [Penicillium angulare]|uniref:Short-chain dehydrogenase/reductase SDR n=1 Tax=Penicillium angulare TaxID=116970 RepID=A0A9W9FWL2_9EURO|nr:hypothetical protein N7456_004035 [Penicillium angulare]
MAGNSPVLLILGSGPNIGTAVGKAFADKGYRVAFASRRADSEKSTAEEVHMKVDLAVPTSIAEVFSKVKEALGIPSVVVYNASGGTMDNPQKSLGVPLDAFMNNLNLNVNSVYAAMQSALEGFAELDSCASKTFIMTGNALNKAVFPPMLSLGVGKTAAAHLIEYAAKSYAITGYKFYYADQRDEDGSPAWFGIDGEAHAKYYLKLAEGKSQGIWDQTFTPQEGYKVFSRYI